MAILIVHAGVKNKHNVKLENILIRNNAYVKEINQVVDYFYPMI